MRPPLSYLPELTPRQWKVLLLVSSATFFDYYDIILISLALKQIQTDLGIDDVYIGWIGAVVQFGKIPAIFVGVVADRFGRRPVLLWTIVGYTIFTGLTAFATGQFSFVLFQFLARLFATSEVILAHVVVAEEIHASHRGWGIGFMSALAALGSGMAYLLFGLVDLLPGGWRGLFLIGLVPLLLLIFLRRDLPETQRFAASSAGPVSPWALALDFRAHLRPLLDMVRVYPGRFLIAGCATFFFYFSQEVGYFLTPRYLQESHDWLPYHISLLAPFGVFAVLLNVIGGWYGDRFGRKPATLLFLFLTGVAGFFLFNGSGFVFLAAALLCVGGFSAAARTNLFIYSAELFPTSYRSTAGGGLMILNSLGGMGGLAAESVLFALTGSHQVALTILVATILPALLVVAFFPETSGRTLEEISPERN